MFITALALIATALVIIVVSTVVTSRNLNMSTKFMTVSYTVGGLMIGAAIILFAIVGA